MGKEDGVGLPHWSEEETERRAAERHLLGQLAGYQRLSEKQQQFIAMSLYIQQRAERATDKASSARIQAMPERFQSSSPEGVYIKHPDHTTNEPWTRYRESQLSVMTNYCHETVRKLERYANNAKQTATEWSDAGPIRSFEDLESLISLVEARGQPPFVVEIAGILDGHRRLEHTTVLLGKNEGGNWIAWEKSGWHMPYQLTELSHLYTAYKDCTDWRIRELAT